MPVIKELQDIVDLLGEYDRKYQEKAVRDLLSLVETAEEDIADSHLSDRERRDAGRERYLIRYEQRYGKEAGDKLRAKIAAILRGDEDSW